MERYAGRHRRRPERPADVPRRRRPRARRARVAPFDEDCLTLNVWAPAIDGARRPVLVWIHGGGFVSGSGSLPGYSGETFARDGDLVVVSINYRIGPLGYLYTDEGDEGGNHWLTDQLAALRWVKENIASFGGDPDRITVAGQSGGAVSTAALAGHPQAQGLIRRVILQSPPFGLDLPTRTRTWSAQPPFSSWRAPRTWRNCARCPGRS
ncbi:carboxylesterase family protein [Streptomyces sp. MS1.HAVA.3]|uniref:Carboxylic ester hydrolase n=1 Tax=Streptomyces caledonius TaxID=3134107 RepID=A0ABU8UDD0_9ACTN